MPCAAPARPLESHAAGQRARAPRAFLVSPHGTLGNSGDSTRSPLHPSAVPTLPLRPGDRILLEGGQTFFGPLVFGPSASGITLESYGSGVPAVIDARAGSTTDGICVWNASGLAIRNLRLLGSQGAGIHLLAGSGSTSDVVIDHVDVSGFSRSGILIEGKNGWGCRNIRITDSRVYRNGDGILAITDDDLAHHRDVYVGRCCACNNKGTVSAKGPTGSGIVLGGVDGGTVEHCAAYLNGGENNPETGGPIGIWAFASNNITIQHCESRDNHSACETDGGGFDFDGGVTNSVMRNNYSHGNDGAGFMVCDYSGAGAIGNLVFEGNRSVNDSRRGAWGGGLVSVFCEQTFCEQTRRAAAPVVFRSNRVELSDTPGIVAGILVLGSGLNLRYERNHVTVRGKVPPFLAVAPAGVPKEQVERAAEVGNVYVTASSPSRSQPRGRLAQAPLRRRAMRW